VFQIFSPLTWRPRPELFFARRHVAEPAEIRVPTRHGAVRCLIYRPPSESIASERASHLPPVHVQIHGGGFYGRYPEQDAHIATYIASEVGAVVVSIDYDVTPQVRFPVAEEECYDVARWVAENGPANGWDATRISVGGESAGGKLAINVCQLGHVERTIRPCALFTAFAVADMTRADRVSSKRDAKIAPWIQRVISETYVADASRRMEPICSPLFDDGLAAALPATLIMTGEYDTLAPEMDRLAARLNAAGVPVVHRRFAATDHGFTHVPPVETAREAIEAIGAFLRTALAPS
jgi:acetyl esterase